MMLREKWEHTWIFQSGRGVNWPGQLARCFLLSGTGEIVSKEVGEEERGTGVCMERRSDDATAVDVEVPQSRRICTYTGIYDIHIYIDR